MNYQFIVRWKKIKLNQINYFTAPRLICSKVNEDNIGTLSVLPGKKSFTMNFRFLTLDERLSPTIDTNRTAVITTTNRLNSVITNYATDGRASSLNDDPTAFQYVTKLISLANPGSAIKILILLQI